MAFKVDNLPSPLDTLDRGEGCAHPSPAGTWAIDDPLHYTPWRYGFR